MIEKLLMDLLRASEAFLNALFGTKNPERMLAVIFFVLGSIFLGAVVVMRCIQLFHERKKSKPPKKNKGDENGKKD